MSPAVAATLTLALLLALLYNESSGRRRADAALWLPVLWMVVTGSRFVSQWIAIGQPTVPGGEGSPIDAAYFSTLMLASVWVLHRRNVAVGQILRSNRWIVVFFLYCLVSVLWSDYPFVAFRRWVKVLGHPLMALVILTDPNPEAALRTVFKRCAYVLLSCSVLLIKYFPEYGRAFDDFTGEPVNRGVGLTKNDLGYVCMVFGLYFVWALLTSRRISSTSVRRREVLISIMFLGATAYLFDLANSMTSLMGFVVGSTVILILLLPIVSIHRLGTWIAVAVIVAFGLDAMFDLQAELFRLLGRKPTLTDRTVVWADVLALQDRPILGFGFESFWLGSTRDALWAKWWWRPTQSHNGYIETYLNLGAIGVMLLVAMLLSTFRKIRDSAMFHFDLAVLRMAMLIAIIMFNYTEAAFQGVHLIWTIFCIVAIETTSTQVARRGERRGSTGTSAHSQ